MTIKPPLVIALASIKGGVGKTHLVILLSRFLAAAGLKVLLADSDLNNSLSNHELDPETMAKTGKLNFATALADESNNLCEFAVPTTTAGIDLIASSAYLSDLRSVNEKRLKRMIPALNGKYDVFIIDCHPTYDNIVLNALHAAEYVITPALKDLFSYNAVKFMAEVLPRDVEGLRNWFVLLNGYDRRNEEAKSGRQRDFVELYRKAGWPLTPAETWLPWTGQINQIVDYHKKLARTGGIANSVCHPALYNAVAELAGCFFDEPLAMPEAF